MKLEIARFPVQDVVFGQRTAYKNSVLEINKEELLALVLQDSRIVSADLPLFFRFLWLSQHRCAYRSLR